MVQRGILAGLVALALRGAASVPPLQSGVLNVRDFGAKGDGANLDSGAINAAIEAAAARGGGTVFLPAGTYRSVSIRLRSDVSLDLDEGAVLRAADRGPGRGVRRLGAEPERSVPGLGPLPLPQQPDLGASDW